MPDVDCETRLAGRCYFSGTNEVLAGTRRLGLAVTPAWRRGLTPTSAGGCVRACSGQVHAHWPGPREKLVEAFPRLTLEEATHLSLSLSLSLSLFFQCLLGPVVFLSLTIKL